MPDRAILSVGAYLPMLRFERAAGARALRWSGLAGSSKGRRSVAGHDEDALTLAVEAARIAVRACPEQVVSNVVFGSTSAPFHERSHGTILVEALGLPAATRSQDVAGSRRSAMSGLVDHLLDGRSTTLITAGEKRGVKAGSAFEMGWGDGAAAVVVGPGPGLAAMRGVASLSHDLVDVYAAATHPAPYGAEERWIRDVAVSDIMVPTIARAFAEAGIKPDAVTWAAVPEPAAATYKPLAAKVGLSAPNVCAEIQVAAGDLGAAMPLFGLVLALERARPGDLVLAAGFGSDCEAAVFEVFASRDPEALSATPALGQGKVFDDYVRLLSLEGAVDLDWGPRSELDQKVQATVLGRSGREMHGFIGGRCRVTGVIQFPRTRVGVNPNLHAIDSQDEVRLADVSARIVSITADRLNYTPDPPFHFGLVQFENGARVLMEFVDIADNLPAVGDEVRMSFRIKSRDRRRGFRHYFWKAAPVRRAALEV